MKNPFELVQSTWQIIASVGTTSDTAKTDSQIQLQTLEDRVLYDASPLGAVVTDLNESIETFEDFDYQVEQLNALTSFPDAILAMPHEAEEHRIGEVNPVFEHARQLIVIDERINDVEALINDVLSNGQWRVQFEVIRLDQSTDGVEAITASLSAQGNLKYDAVHIIARGADAQLQLGSTMLTPENLETYKNELSNWTSGMALGTDILLYGCEVAETEQGQWLVDQMGGLSLNEDGGNITYLLTSNDAFLNGRSALVNGTPTASNDSFSVDEDNPLVGDVIAGSDTDPENDALAASLVFSPSNADTFTLNPDGSFTYVPVENFYGSDSFKYQIEDGNGGFDTAQVNISVQPVNDLPIVQNDSFQIMVGQGLTSGVSILLNDVDIDGDALVAILMNNPNNGLLSLNTNGNFVYVPNQGFTGTDSFTYMASDGIGSSATTVEIEVLAAGPTGGGPNPSFPPGGGEPVEPVTEGSLDEAADESNEDDEDENGIDGALLVSGPSQVPVLNLTKRSEFEADGEVKDLIALLTDKGYAQTVLNSILASASLAESNDETESSQLDEFCRRVSGVQTVFDANFLYDQIESQVAVELNEVKFAIGAITTFSSIGYILWTLRGGALIAVAFSQLPSWRMIDPLPVLDSYSSGAAALNEEDEEFGDFFE